ncbi:MAG: T9SS type A sorting domain-containing protein [Bacteroidetes bacterium]|nr:T9SS type A sorting domain-containing protein [Bacteroidota bacterium]
MKYIYITFALLFSTHLLHADDCSGGRYTDYIFDSYTVDENNIYARKQMSNGTWQNLRYDVYQPKDDTETNRAAVFLAHGGGFINLLNQKSPDIVRIARDLVARGYVVISVEYREEPTFLSLLSEEAMVKALARALIDIRSATCYLMDTTLNYNNPYGVDPSRVIIGGVSAGAVSFLHAVFLDSLTWAPPQYQDWILEVEPNTQALLDDKYCGANVIGLINVSGAVMDTNWIKPYKANEYPAVMHVHGTADNIVPYDIGLPFGLPTLPKLMGSYPIDQKLQAIGVRSELDTWNGLGHVPFFGVDLSSLFSPNPSDVIFTPTVLNPTLEHIGEFCSSLVGCPDIILSATNDQANKLNFYPNPNYGQFTIDLPDLKTAANGHIQIVNTNGQLVFEQDFRPDEKTVALNTDLSKGIYTLIVDFDGPFENKYLEEQLVILN